MTLPKSIVGKRLDQRKLHIFLWNNRDRQNNVWLGSQTDLYNSLGFTKKHMSYVFKAMALRGWVKKVPGTNNWQIFDPKKFYDPNNLDEIPD